MPTYEYRREDGSVFEVMQSMNDEALKICPTTGQPVKRIISGGGGVVYKGTGWYVTDYKNAGNGNSKGTEGSGGQNSEPKKESEPVKSESAKPAEKTQSS